MAPPLRQEVENQLSPLRQAETAIGVARKAIKKLSGSALIQSDPVLVEEVNALRKRLKKAKRSAASIVERCAETSETQ